MDDSNDAVADSESLRLGLGFLGKTVNVVVDRPLGSRHPTAGFEYLLNYGFILGVPAPDGEDLDAYVVGLHSPAAEVTGLCIAVVHRLYEDDDKLIVAADGVDRADDCLRRLVAFQEDGRPYVLVRSSAYL
jgi:inorganic pyrophosphatase